MLLGGASYGSDRAGLVQIEDLAMLAGAIRIVQPIGAKISGVMMAGAWRASDGSVGVTRSYMNGTGTATAASSFGGWDRYVFVRAGLVARPDDADEIALSGEAGSQRWRYDGFAEKDGPANPFPAFFTAERGSMGVARARAIWTRQWSGRIDTTLWGAGAWTFDRRSDLKALINGAGVLTPRIDSPRWAEYGARIGYRLSDRARINLFADGLSAPDQKTRAHVGLEVKYRF